jgi:hypothetical protein
MTKPCFLLFAFVLSFGVPFGVVYGQTPAPDYKEPTLDEVWDRSPAIIYGRIVALEIAPAAEGENAYLAYVLVERTWKGAIKPREEVVILETFPDGAGKGFALQFNRTYILQVSKRENSKRYERTGAQEIVLPIPRSVSPVGSSNFGGVQSVPFLTWVEFLERKAGNTAEADRIRKLRGQETLDREANSSKDKIMVDRATADFRTAMNEEGIAERMALLDALLKRIQYSGNDELVALTAKIKAEISLGATFLAAGRKTFPSQ